MSKVIEKQKEVADEVLAALENKFPDAVLAGGAPRNWWMDNTANDLDFYVHLGANFGPRVFGQFLSDATRDLRGFTSYSAGWWRSLPEEVRDNLEYKTIEDLQYISTFFYRGCKLQFMAMKTQEAMESLLGDFSTSICEISYKNGEYKPTERFLQTMEDKVIRLGEGCSWRDPHPRKIARYFEDDFTFETGEDGYERQGRLEAFRVAEPVDPIRVFDGGFREDFAVFAAATRF